MKVSVCLIKKKIDVESDTAKTRAGKKTGKGFVENYAVTQVRYSTHQTDSFPAPV